MTISYSQIQNHGGRAANHYSAPWVGVLRRAVPLPRNDAKRSDEFFHPKCKMHKCKRRIRFSGMSLRKWMDSVAGLDKAEYIYRVIFKSGPQDARRMDNTCIFPLQKAAENSIFWPRIHTTWHPHFKQSLQHPSPRLHICNLGWFPHVEDFVVIPQGTIGKTTGWIFKSSPIDMGINCMKLKACHDHGALCTRGRLRLLFRHFLIWIC